MKKFKVLLLSSIFLMVSIVSASAYPKIDFYLDFTKFGYKGPGATDDGKTGLMSQISLVQNSEIIQSLTDFSFTELGVGYSDGFGFIGAIEDDEGRNKTGGYELTFDFNLSGFASSISPNQQNQLIATFNFTPGGFANVYFDTILNRTPNITVTDPKSYSDYNNYSDGNKIAELILKSGWGLLNLSTGEGVTYLDFAFVDNSDYYDIWFDKNDQDLVKTYGNLLLGFVDTTQKNIEFNDLGTFYKIFSTGNGGLEISAIPEPGTMMLLGFGLLGLAGVSRRRNRK